MTHTFQLAKGKITFEENKLQIEDTVIKERNQFTLIIVIAFFQSCFLVFLYVKRDDLFSLVMSPIFFF